MRKLWGSLAILVVLASCSVAEVPYHAQGEKAGEPTQDSIIILTRLTAVEKGEIGHDVPGMAGHACFEIAEAPDFKSSHKTRWATATADNDYIIKQTITGLKPGCQYHYRVHIRGLSGGEERLGPARQFKTAPSIDRLTDVTFTVITGQGYETRDSDRGHHTYLTMEQLGLDFIALTGDTVYYDGARGGIPRKLGEVKAGPAEQHLRLRPHWHAIYALPIQREFFGKVAGYWEVDDHDYHHDDCTQYYAPGSRVFREQNPVPEKTFRTVRWGKALQIWLVEGREFRDKQSSPATIWGKAQFDWLVQSLAKSDATFKILISPTPLVGAGERGKGDNHASAPFLEERQEFFEALKQRSVKNFFVVCGDRHWKYHSTSKEFHVHEFCSGALSNRHAIRGIASDRSGLVKLHYVDTKAVGGFLRVEVKAEGEYKGNPQIDFQHFDSTGKMLYSKSFRAGGME